MKPLNKKETPQRCKPQLLKKIIWITFLILVGFATILNLSNPAFWLILGGSLLVDSFSDRH